MAPSFDIGNPQRSLVRIPGSGQDKSLKPICLDVAQISIISKTLSDVMNFNFSAPPEQVLGGTLNITSVTPNLSSNTESNSRPAAQPGNGARKRNAEEEDASQRFKRSAISNSPYLRNIHLTRIEKLEKMRDLEIEEKTLLEENAELSKKVAMFKDILKSRSKLKEFLKALEELAC